MSRTRRNRQAWRDDGPRETRPFGVEWSLKAGGQVQPVGRGGADLIESEMYSINGEGMAHVNNAGIEVRFGQ